MISFILESFVLCHANSKFRVGQGQSLLELWCSSLTQRVILDKFLSFEYRHTERSVRNVTHTYVPGLVPPSAFQEQSLNVDAIGWLHAAFVHVQHLLHE